MAPWNPPCEAEKGSLRWLLLLSHVWLFQFLIVRPAVAQNDRWAALSKTPTSSEHESWIADHRFIAVRALGNPDLFKYNHFRQAVFAVAVGIAIQLIIQIPV